MDRLYVRGASRIPHQSSSINRLNEQTQWAFCASQFANHSEFPPESPSRMGGTLVIQMITCNYSCFRELIFWWLQLQIHFLIPSRTDSREKCDSSLREISCRADSARFFSIWRLKNARSMGWPEKSKKQSKKRQRKTIFSADFFCRIFREFSVCVFRSENGKRRRKTVSQNVNSMAWWFNRERRSGSPANLTNVPMGAARRISKNGLFLQLAALNRSSHQQFLGKTLWLQLHLGIPRGIHFAKITLTITFFLICQEFEL